MMASPTRRNSLIVTVLLCAASAVAAQGWEAGAKSGINHTSIAGGSEFAWDRTATSAIFFRQNFYGPFSFQPELAHARRTGVSSVAGTALTLTADYVEMPLLLGAQLISAYGIAPFVVAGPSIAARVRCRL